MCACVRRERDNIIVCVCGTAVDAVAAMAITHALLQTHTRKRIVTDLRGSLSRSLAFVHDDDERRWGVTELARNDERGR